MTRLSNSFKHHLLKFYNCQVCETGLVDRRNLQGNFSEIKTILVRLQPDEDYKVFMQIKTKPVLNCGEFLI